MKKSRVSWPLLAVLAVAAFAAAALAAYFTRARPAEGIRASGMIEATTSDVSPKVAGRLVSLRVHDGDRVARGALLGSLERSDPALNLDQARANVAAAEAQVAAARAGYAVQRATYGTTLASAQSELRIAGSRVAQADVNLALADRTTRLAIAQAQAQVGVAQAARERARIDLQRYRALVRTGDAPRMQLDNAEQADRTAAGQLDAARDALRVADADREGVRLRSLDVAASNQQRRQSAAALANAQAQTEVVDQRRAQLLAAEAALDQARAVLGLAVNQLRETQLRAPFAGYVVSHNFEPGDLVQPGSAVLTIGDLDHPYMYVYVSETDLPRVKEGALADVTIDGLPGRTFVARVTEIGSTAEFTPENVQTREQRIQYLVFRVKLQFTDTTGTLKPGLPADAVIHV